MEVDSSDESQPAEYTPVTNARGKSRRGNQKRDLNVIVQNLLRLATNMADVDENTRAKSHRRRGPRSKGIDAVQIVKDNEPSEERSLILVSCQADCGRSGLNLAKELCRDLFKDKFQVSTDDDFVTHKSADPALVLAHSQGQAAPDPKDLHFDMKAGPNSAWNSVVIDILVSKLEKRRGKAVYNIPQRSREYLEDLVRDRYNRVRSSWKRGQPKLTDAGVRETPEQVENRLLTRKDQQCLAARTRERRVLVC
jgi:hypothetical protein